MTDFAMPSLGADMEEGTVLEWLVHPGDTVHRGDLMAVVDTDKAAVEVETFSDGVVGELLVEPGTRVRVGTPLARLAPLGAAVPAPEPAAVPAPVEPELEPEPSAPAAPAGGVRGEPSGEGAVTVPRPRVAPPLRHHAAELGVDLSTVTGTGTHGGVTRADIDRAAARAASAAPAPAGTVASGAPSTWVTDDTSRAPEPVVRDPSAPAGPAAAAPEAARPPEQRRVSPYARRLADELGVDLAAVVTAPGAALRAEDVRAAAQAAAERTAAPTASAPAGPAPVRRTAGPASRTTIAALMSRSKREIPHYYVATTVDLEATTAWLRRTNLDRPVATRILPAAAILRAVALAARQLPALNGFWIDDHVVAGEDVHLGVAVHVRGGALVAPALLHAADLPLEELMAALRDLVQRARSGRLSRAELTDPTLTVTDLGDQGVEEVLGVIYPPQVALVGVGRVVERPWAVDGMLGVRPVVRLTLSGDHRATDGATGARFLGLVDRLLQHPEDL